MTTRYSSIRLILLAGLCLIDGLGWAQAINNSGYVLTASECTNSAQTTGAYPAQGIQPPSGANVFSVSTNTTCGGYPATPLQLLNGNQVPVATLGGPTATGACPTPPATSQTYYICWFNSGTFAQVPPITSFTVGSTAAPAGITNILGGDLTISFTLTGTVGGTTYQLCTGPGTMVTPCSSPFSIYTSTFTATGTSLNISFSIAANGVPYSFAVQSLASGSTPAGSWSSVSQGQGVPAYSVLQDYNGAPGPVQFGCRATNAPDGWMLFAVVGLLLLGRKRKISLAPFLKGGILLVVLISAMPGVAEIGSVNVGLLASPYIPNLNGTLQSNGSPAYPIYSLYFNNAGLFLPGIEADVHVFDEFGSLQVGLGARYTYVGGKALSNSESQGPSATTNDSVGLHMYQLRPQVTYIFDPYVEDFPLVPFARAAIVANGYAFTYNGGADKRGGPVKPAGIVFGYSVGGGLMLQLDWIDQKTASAARTFGFFNHSYVKAEIAYEKINTFGSGGFDFSPTGILGSTPLLMTFGIVMEIL